MTLNGTEIDHLAVTDANGAVLAVIADDENICYNGVRLIANAVLYEVPYEGRKMIYAKEGVEACGIE